MKPSTQLACLRRRGWAALLAPCGALRQTLPAGQHCHKAIALPMMHPVAMHAGPAAMFCPILRPPSCLQAYANLRIPQLTTRYSVQRDGLHRGVPSTIG